MPRPMAIASRAAFNRLFNFSRISVYRMESDAGFVKFRLVAEGGAKVLAEGQQRPRRPFEIRDEIESVFGHLGHGNIARADEHPYGNNRERFERGQVARHARTNLAEAPNHQFGEPALRLLRHVDCFHVPPTIVSVTLARSVSTRSLPAACAPLIASSK